MRIPYGYQTEYNYFIISQEKAKVVHMIIDYYLSGSSLGEIADILYKKSIPSSTGKEIWTRTAIDKILSNAKHIPYLGHLFQKT